MNTKTKTEWRMVPVQPTATQIKAGQIGVTTSCAKAIYVAMLNTAPTPPKSGPRPDDDALFDQTLQERDRYHEVADKLADAIAEYLGIEIGEHSSMNDPWLNALEAIENDTPPKSEGCDRNAVIEQCAKVCDDNHWEDHRLFADAIRAMKSQPAAPDKNCEYCDGTGDVHSFDGEWRGVCTCEAGQRISAPDKRDEAHKEDK